MGRIIGIDLGTTNSEAAIMEAGRPVILPSAEGGGYGGKNFPSVVAFAKDGTLLVGEPAKRQAVLNPERTLMRIKRRMGTDYRVTIDDKTYTPEQISAFVLQKIKRDAEAYLGEEVTEAVITVPAYFDDNQRSATKAAGEIAGLSVKRIINEPTAAALAYGLDKEGSAVIAVYDFGGGTLDVTVMEMGDGVFEVKSTSGDTQLGGSDMDDALVRWVADRFKTEHHVDLSRDRQALQRIRDAVERAKHELTTSVQATLNLPYLTQDAKGPKHLEYTLSRAKLEEVVRPIVERTRAPVLQALKDAKLTAQQIDKVILVGGPTRMPIVQQFVEELFGKKPVRGVDPMQCVAVGASIQAAILSGEIDKEIVLLDVTPLTLGIETLGGVATALIQRNTTIPTKKSQVFSTAADYQPMVEVHVLQGERPMARDNRSLGKFHLDGIPPAPRGVPQVEVTFDIDSNGILTVRAKDLGTKREQHITVTGTTRLPSEEIDRMRDEAEKFKEEDEKRSKVVEAKNLGDTAAYQAERFLKDSKEKLDAKDVAAIEKAIAALREALATEDLARIAETQNALQQAMAGPVTKMYKDAAEEAEASSRRGGAPGSSSAADAAQPQGGGAEAGAAGGGKKAGAKGTDGEPNDPAFDADYDVKP